MQSVETETSVRFIQFYRTLVFKNQDQIGLLKNTTKPTIKPLSSKYCHSNIGWPTYSLVVFFGNCRTKITVFPFFYIKPCGLSKRHLPSPPFTPRALYLSYPPPYEATPGAWSSSGPSPATSTKGMPPSLPFVLCARAQTLM